MKNSALVIVCVLALGHSDVSAQATRNVVSEGDRRLRRQTVDRRVLNEANTLRRQQEQAKKAEEENRQQEKAIDEAHAWLHSINYKVSRERVTQMTTLRLQLYGKFDGVSTQVLISNENMKHIRVMKNLEVLALPTWTNDDGLSNVAGLTKLKTLNVPKARLTNKGMAHLENLKSLRSLVLTGAKIHGEGVTHLGGMTNLEILNLSGTSITDADMKVIGGISSLSKLFLNHTQITDAAIPSLLKLKHLQRLDLNGAKITAQGRQQLKSALPNLVIH